MLGADRRAEQLVTEEVLPILRKAAAEGRLSELHIPTDEELGRDAARAYADYQARGYAHLDPYEAFCRGYGAAVRYLYGLFGLYEEDLRIFGPILVSPGSDETQWMTR